MLNPARLLRLLNELIFVLLGLVLIWTAGSQRYFMNRRDWPWVGLAIFLLFWGWRAWRRPVRAPGKAARREAAAAAVRGGSLGLVGALMLGIAWLPFPWVAPLLSLAGAILMLRGVVTMILLARAP